MANIGIARASYYADTSIHRLNRDLEVSVGRVASAKKNLTASDVASLKSMDYSFRLDFAATKAAVKSMSVTQAYLSTAISSLDSSSAILAKIHELAVLGANGSNSDSDQASLNAEAEILADEFHKAMQVSNFKGRVVLGEENAGSKMSLGQSSAQTGNFGLGEVDYDFFYFPAYADKDLGKPVLGGGTVLTATNMNRVTTEFMKFLMHPEAHERFMEKGGFLTPHTGVDTSKYASDTFRGLHEILQQATTFRFDGSDLMPGWVGAGSFWTGMVDYTNGKSAQEVADAIQASWEAGE